MKTTEKNSTKSNKAVQDVAVKVTYSKKQMTVFQVHIKEGKFIVIDYKNRFNGTPDTEVFWEARTQAVSQFTPEFKAASKAVEIFLKTGK